MAGLSNLASTLFASPAQAQSLSRVDGGQVTPPSLDPSPAREKEGSAADAEQYWGDANENLSRFYFRQTLTPKEMGLMDRLKAPKAEGGEGLNEIDARLRIMRSRTPRDLNGRDYE